MSAVKNEIFEYALREYGAKPEYLWANDRDSAVLRHGDNNKWYAVFMTVKKSALGLDGGGKADIIDVKCDPLLIGSMILNDGYLPAYHMNKTHWITILLDGSVSAEEVINMLNISYELTKKKR